MASKLPRNSHVKRENCDSVSLSSQLREQICTAFDEKYGFKGRANMSRFLNQWEIKIGSKPPTGQTIRNLRSRSAQQNFEYWLVDGCCRLLLDCTFEEWEKKNRSELINTSDGAECTESNPQVSAVKLVKEIANDFNRINLLHTDLEEKFKFLSGVIQEINNPSEESD